MTEKEAIEGFTKLHGRPPCFTLKDYLTLPQEIALKLHPIEHRMVLLDTAKLHAQKLVDELRKKVEALEKKVEERGALKYCGTYKLDTDYEKGDACTYTGSLWVARERTTARPGTGPEWTLAVKKGRDAR